MIRFLFLTFTCYFSVMAAEPCQSTATGTSRSLFFGGIADLVLHGYGYRTLTGKSAVQCGNLCLSDSRCFSINFSEKDKLCELNGATASQYPGQLTERTGGHYYGPEETDAFKLLQSSQPGKEDPPKYEDRSMALSGCQRANKHLCQPWELQQGFEAGNYSGLQGDVNYWYSGSMSRVSVNSNGLTYHDLPRPLITDESYGKEDREGITEACSAMGAHLCTLGELKEAFLNGYSQPSWGTWIFFSLPGRDVRVDDGCGDYIGDECYEGIVPNTPRPHDSGRVYCCEAWSTVSSPVLCCPGLVSPRDPIITTETFAVGDRIGIANACSVLGAHPCTLAEMKEAYLWGYRPPTQWLFFAEPDRDMTLFRNGCGSYTGDECYEDIVPNTPRPSPDKCEVFCCPMTRP